MQYVYVLLVIRLRSAKSTAHGQSCSQCGSFSRRVTAEELLQPSATRNGSYLREQLVRVTASPLPQSLVSYISDGFVSVGGIYGIGDGSDAHGDILTSSYLIGEWGLPEKIVLIDGDGHSWIAFDYRKHDGDDPPVIYIESESARRLSLPAISRSSFPD